MFDRGHPVVQSSKFSGGCAFVDSVAALVDRSTLGLAAYDDSVAAFQYPRCNPSVDQVLIQLAAFGVVAFSIWMTIWFMSQMLQPVPAADSQFEPEFLLLNAVLCWPQPDPFASDAKRVHKDVGSLTLNSRTASLSGLMRVASWVACIGMLASSGFATQRLLRDHASLIAPATPAVNESRVNEYAWRETFPAAFGRWRQMVVANGFKFDEGKRRAVVDWKFDWQGQVVELQIAFPYNTRPDFAKAYLSRGWNVLDDRMQRFAAKSKESAAKEALINKVDSSVGSSESENAEPNASHEWRILKVANELGGRATAIVTYHRMNNLRANANPNRSALEYQVTLFCESGDELLPPQQNELYNTFLNATDRLHETIQPHLSEMLGVESE